MISKVKFTRREFIGLAGASLGLLGVRALLSGGTRQETEETPLPPNAREAMYYAGLSGDLRCEVCHGNALPSKVLYCHISHAKRYVKCLLCPRGCVISEGHRGDCRVRENRGGKLYTMVFGNPCAMAIDPIEKKPFYHFLPASAAFSIATAGCNLHCLYCQNYDISQVPPEQTENYDLPPEKVVAAALGYGCPVIAYTYSEPTVFYEYTLATARLARKAGIRNVVVSAGYMNPDPLRELCGAVDAIKIDFKGFSDDFYKNVCSATLQPVLDGMKLIRDSGIHLEIVTLVVPGMNDSEENLRDMARWIIDNLGPDVPTHFSRFFPRYKLTNLPATPAATVERARAIALEEGIHYAYTGNLPGSPGDHTYCARCGKILIQRLGFQVMENNIVDGKCRYCGQPIPGVWQ